MCFSPAAVSALGATAAFQQAEVLCVVLWDFFFFFKFLILGLVKWVFEGCCNCQLYTLSPPWRVRKGWGAGSSGKPTALFLLDFLVPLWQVAYQYRVSQSPMEQGGTPQSLLVPKLKVLVELLPAADLCFFSGIRLCWTGQVSLPVMGLWIGSAKASGFLSGGSDTCNFKPGVLCWLG